MSSHEWRLSQPCLSGSWTVNKTVSNVTICELRVEGGDGPKLLPSMILTYVNYRLCISKTNKSGGQRGTWNSNDSS